MHVVGLLSINHLTGLLLLLLVHWSGLCLHLLVHLLEFQFHWEEPTLELIIILLSIFGLIVDDLSRSRLPSQSSILTLVF